MKRLLFVTSFDYPSRYAHAIHGMYMAQAFHKALQDNFLFFVNTAAKGTLAGIPHRLLFGRFGRRIKKMHLRRVLMSFVLLRFFLLNSFGRGGALTVFAIDSELIPLLSALKRLFGFVFIFEIHRILPLGREHSLVRSADRFIFITQALRADFVSRHPELTARCIVVPEAVDVARFIATPDESRELRHELSLPQEVTLVGYIGRFEPLNYDKGLKLMMDATRDLPGNVHVLLVGGSQKEIADYTAYLLASKLEGRVTLVPHVPSQLVPHYAKACDVLAYVPPAGTVFFEKETSPMKLFEYMAAKRPIVVSDLPTTREILDDDSAFFVAPGSREAFVAAIEKARSDTVSRERCVRNAFARVEGNTWEHRAARILEDLS